MRPAGLGPGSGMAGDALVPGPAREPGRPGWPTDEPGDLHRGTARTHTEHEGAMTRSHITGPIRALVLALGLAAMGTTAWGQASPAPGAEVVSPDAQPAPAEVENLGTGQSLADILARQNGTGAAGDPDSAAGAATRLGQSLGNPTAETYRQLRTGEDVTVTTAGPATGVLIQEGGLPWLEFREGPLVTYGLSLMGVVAGLLALFYLLRGRVRIDGPPTGRTVLRFGSIERFSHWLLSGSFLLLALTGILLLIGRPVIIPLLGHDANAVVTGACKWVHNNVSWAFMLALVLIFALWVRDNIPNRGDIRWLARAGGMLGGGHVPARRFNAGQKGIFWAVVIFGASISASGLSLLFPFELPMFAKTFGWMEATGIPGLVGLDLPTALAPQEEMQLAQSWHSIVSFVLLAIIVAHIYIGSLGMEGAYAAMGSGRVEEAWAAEHHSIWLDEVRERRPSDIQPAAGPQRSRAHGSGTPPGQGPDRGAAPSPAE